MSKFLQSRVAQGISAEFVDSNLLTVSGLRSLIPGDFCLLEIMPRENTPLASVRPCFLLLHEKCLSVLYQCHQNGIIHGDAAESVWTCFNYLGDGKSFDNPLVQNEENISLLASLLKLPAEEFYSCILFDNECELRRIPANTPQSGIIWADQVEGHFANLLPKLPVRYSHTQLEALHDIFVLVSNEG